MITSGIDALLSWTNLELALLLIVAALCGLIVRVTLGWAKQRWATTHANSLSYPLLPAIGLVITKTISGNIALSLGMIGALSIVRFRHPVKSPLELVVFFLLLTVGISLPMAPVLAMLLVGLFITVIVAGYGYETFRKRQGRSSFALSFDEGDTMHFVEVTARKPLPDLAQNEALVHQAVDATAKEYDYRLAFRNRADSLELYSKVEKSPDIVSAQVKLG